MRRFFNADNSIFRFLSRVTDIMILNIIFLVTCIPVITIGSAWTSLYYVTLKMVRDEDSYIIRTYFKSFKDNFMQATIMWMITLAVIVLLFVAFRTLGTGFDAVRIGIILAYIIIGMVLVYLFPVLSRFYNNIGKTFMNAAVMSFRHLPQTLIMLAIITAAVLLTLINSMTLMYGIMVWVLVGFAVIAYVNSWFLVRIFDKYISE